MAAWGKWFEQMKDNIVNMAGPFAGGREISKAGAQGTTVGTEMVPRDLRWGVRAGSLDEAEKMAQSNPYISSVRIYEVMSR